MPRHQYLRHTGLVALQCVESSWTSISEVNEMCNNSFLTLSIWSESKTSQIKGLSITRLLLPQTPTIIPGYSYYWMTNCNLCFCSAALSCLTLCDPIDHSKPGFPVLHSLSEFTQTHVLWLHDAIQPSHLLSSPFPPALNLSPIRVFSNESPHLSFKSAFYSPLPLSSRGSSVPLHFLP